jgi:hypothetical protein
MKFVLIITCVLLSTVGFAVTKSFEVQINELSINGSLNQQPRKINVNPNQKVVISRSFDPSGANIIVEMTVADDNSKVNDGILIKLSIVEEKNGTIKVIGTPQMIVKSGSGAEITQGNEGETLYIKANLTGTRVL